VSTHVIEVGPNNIRRLCCGGEIVDDDEMVVTAFDSIDDPVTLIDLRPVTVGALWRTVLGSHACVSAERAIVVHPSWWPPTRIDLISGAAEPLASEVMLRPRSWLLAEASPVESRHATVIIEIAECFVVIIGAEVIAETRRGKPERVARAVIRSIRAMMSDAHTAVVIDAPSTVGGASELAAMIAEGLYVNGRISAIRVDDAGLKVLAAQAIQDTASTCEPPSALAVERRHRRHWGPLLAAVLLIIAVSGLMGALRLGRRPVPVGEGIGTTFLVEGHVALEVPAQWPIQRIVSGPGSARVQVTSPSDPEVALHVTQSQLAIATMSATAESLKHAIDAEPSGVFVDFNPVATSAGRPAVTYREVRSGHDIQWIVLVDKVVRISIGCQSRRGQDDAVRQVCDLAVRSARAVD
jgi:type VII secretion-associated protein (TIGR03931 family)